MNKLTRALSAVTAAAMLVSLAACNGSSSTSSSAPAPSASGSAPASTGSSDTGSSSSAPEQKERELLTITGYFPMHASSALEDIPEGGWMLDKMYEEKFNVKWDWYNVPATDGESVFNITMASGDIPDVVVQGSWSKLNKYKDAWWELDDFIKGKYPNLEKAFYDDPYVYALSANQDTGKIQILSNLSEQKVGDVLLVRGDLLEEWGVTVKDNMTKEECYELLKLAKEKDPKLTPFMTRMKTEGLIRRLCEGWSGVPQYAFVDTDNVVKFGGADERMKDVVIWLNQLYSEGLIDPEFPTSDTAAWQEKVLNDGVFMTHDNASSRIKWAINEWANLGVTGKWYKAISPLSPDGTTKGQTTIHYPRLRDALAIFTKASEEKVDRIMEMLNYSFSDEGYELLNYGIEGVSFTKDANGEYQIIPEYQEPLDANTLPQDQRVKGNITRMARLECNGIYLPTNRAFTEVVNAAKLYEEGGYIRDDLTKAIRFNDAEQDIVTRYGADLKTYSDEQLQKFITGTTPIDQWDAYIAGYAQYNLDTYLKAQNDALARALALIS